MVSPHPQIENKTPILRTHMPELDAVRGVAILMVLVYHGFNWGMDALKFSGPERYLVHGAWIGKLGVNLFFVLSGFLITGLLMDTRSRKDYYKRFYVRRALRIFPAYVATLLALMAIGISLKFIGLSALYLSNLTPLFGVGIAYPVLWSLAVEEHFYLAWPAVVRKLSSRALLVCALAIVVVSPFLRWVSFVIAARKGWVSYTVFDYTWNSADGLACGALMAVWLRITMAEPRRLLKMVALVACVGMALLPLGILSRHTAAGAAWQMVPWNLLFTATIGGMLVRGSFSGGTARYRSLEFFGKISYGLYLYHLLVFWGFEWLLDKGVIRRLPIDPFLGISIRFVICGGIALGIAYLSRRYFEEPFLQIKGRLGK